MKIVIAPDSFKESMTAKEACLAIEKGFKSVLKNVEVIKVSMADGGEGTMNALVESSNGIIYKTLVTGPLGNKIVSEFGILGDRKTAIIEMAKASGLELVPRKQRNPMITTTFGTGELIKAALDRGVSTVIIGIGGSATNDGGSGMVQALGGKLLDENRKEISFGGGELEKIRKIDLSNLDKRISTTNFIVACDVKNPLTGDEGAANIFGRQKGATEEMIVLLDKNLKHFAKIIKEELGIDIERIEGSGAAGGLGAGLMAFLSAKLKRGIDIIIKYSELEEKIKNADLIITGEGSIDGQTMFGKAPYGVAQVAKKYGIPIIALVGSINDDRAALYEHGFDAVFSIICKLDTLENTLKLGKNNLEKTSSDIARFYLSIKNTLKKL